MQDMFGYSLYTYAPYVIVGVGFFLIVGAVLGWGWLTDRRGISHTKVFQHWVYDTFGERGYRVLVGLWGLGLIVVGLILAYFLPDAS